MATRCVYQPSESIAARRAPGKGMKLIKSVRGHPGSRYCLSQTCHHGNLKGSDTHEEGRDWSCYSDSEQSVMNGEKAKHR